MDEERITSYIRSLYPPESQLLGRIRREALADDVPIIRPETAALLRFLMAENRPKQILEVGCATGYSSLVMYEALRGECSITTIEKYEKRIPVAKAHFEEAGASSITLLEEDAGEAMERLIREGKHYDMVFMDAAKAQYILWLPLVKQLLVPGGLLMSDNVLQDGDVTESRFVVTRRNRTIHARMREYLFALTHDESLTTTILPVGDGVALSVMKGKETL